MKVRIGDIIGGCFITGWILVLLLFGLSGLLGLATGEIYLPDKKGHGGILHGTTARIVSLIILVISASILSALWRARKRPRVVHPMDQSIDRELERMRERKRRHVGQDANLAEHVERREGTDDDEAGAE
jgi:hypothetical protein